MSRRLHHIALGARDPDLVAAFYRDVLGFEERQRHHTDGGDLRSIWLDLGGDAILMIERTDRTRPHVDGVDAGAFLLAVAIEPDELDALEQRLAEAGSPVEQRTDFTSYARDPEGNRVAISHYGITHHS